MSSAAILQALAGGLGDEDHYLARDPFFTASRQIYGMQMPQATNNTEAILGPALQGLMGGFLHGYGRTSAKDTAYSDYRDNSLIQALSGSEITKGDEGDPLLQAYLNDERPDDWTIAKGKSDLLLGALGKQAAIENEQKKLELREKLDTALIGKGMRLSPDGKTISQIPEYAQIQADAAGAEAGAKKAAEIRAEADALGYNPKREEETDKLRKELSALPEVKNFGAIEKAAKIIGEAVKDESAVADQELVRYSILLVEPGMAVREGEQAAVAASQSIPEAWKGELNRAMRGGSALSPEVREGIKRLAMRSYTGHKDQYDRTLGFYKGEAKRKGLDPDRISYIGESADLSPLLGAATVPPPASGGLSLDAIRAEKERRAAARGAPSGSGGSLYKPLPPGLAW